jgi:uroporphyrinogen-III synthase
MKGGPSRTQNAARFAAEIQRLARQSREDKPVLVALSGQASPRLQTELQSRGFTLHDRVSPCPLK